MLASPVAVGPVSPCSGGVRVQGQLPGARLELYAVTDIGAGATSRHVGSSVAASADVIVALSPGIRLRTGEHLVADQRSDTDYGPPLPAAQAIEVTAEPRPVDLGGLFCGQTLLECATCLWIDGVIPGAVVTLAISNDPPLVGETQDARIKFFLPPRRRLTRTEALVVSQTGCGLSGPGVALAGVALQDRGQWPVAAPSIDGPLIKCQKAILIEGVVPGATVVTEHNGDEQRACFGYPTGWFGLARPLASGDVITVRQEFTTCELRSQTATATVGDGNPAPPAIVAPVCQGDRLVRVAGLLSGALVEFAADGAPLCTASAPDATAIFGLPPLIGTSALAVRQSACGGADGTWSDWSAPCPVAALGQQGEPLIVEPLIDGGVAVGVLGLERGSRVDVVSALGVIGTAYGNGDVRVDVPLWHALVRDDIVTLRTLRCGELTSWPHAARVQGRTDLRPPRIAAPACDCGGSVLVEEVAPGSLVEVYRQGSAAIPSLLGVARAGADTVSVDVPALTGGENLQAAQRMASERSQLGPVATAVDPPNWHYAPDDPQAGPLARLGAFRLCQLTGGADPAGRPHAGPTTGFGIHGTDLGVPVEHDGRLYLFFGDEAETNLDPIAWLTTADADDLETAAPDLNWLLGSGGHFQWLTLDGNDLGNFEVPTGAFSYEGRLYLFIGKDKVEEPHSRMTTSVLAVRDDPHWDFRTVLFISSTTGGQILVLEPDGSIEPAPYPGRRWMLHISPTVVHNADWPGLPSSTGDGLLMFGSSSYRGDLDTTPTEDQLGNVYLAWAPLTPGVAPPVAPIPSADQWHFFAGLTAGTPTWQTLAAGPPTPLLPVDTAGPRKLGEISCVWYPPLRRWILAGSVQAPVNVARRPWGPWTTSEFICHAAQPDRDAQDGSVGWTDSQVTYAPYLIRRWYRWDRSLRTMTLYFTLSGFDDRPGKQKYQPQLIRSTIRCWSP